MSLLAIHLYVTSPTNPPPMFEEYYNRSLAMFRENLGAYDGTLDVRLVYTGLFVCHLHVSLIWQIPSSCCRSLIIFAYSSCEACRGVCSWSA